MARKPYKYHYIYKTVNEVNQKYYIGMHSTNNLDDGYIGSGKRLWYAIKKYGKENFKKEILEYLPDRSSLKEREKEIVNEELLNDSQCMNLQLGGGGGFISDEQQLCWSIAGSKALKEKLKDDEYRKLHYLKIKNGLAKSIENNPGLWQKYKEHCKLINGNAFRDKKHSEETKKKIKLSLHGKQKGNNNSQYGKMWIYNEELKESTRVLKTEPIPEGWKKGRKISWCQ